MSFDIPETMTAIEITEVGGPEVLKTASLPVPQPAAGEMLVRNAAIGVNFLIPCNGGAGIRHRQVPPISLA